MTLASIRSANPLAAFCITKTIGLEGGLVDSAADPGGLTDYGISLRAALAQVALHPDELALYDVDHDGHLDRRDIAGLTQDEAADIYLADWWTPGWYARMAPQAIAWKCFDIAVNTGPNRAARILQQALCDVGAAVPVDGVVGPVTGLTVRGQASKDRGVRLLAAIRAEQAKFYRGLVAAQPKLKTFLAGWLNRATA